MKGTVLFTFLTLVLSGSLAAPAQEKSGQPPTDAELASLRQQNAVLEERIKLLTHQREIDRITSSSPLGRPNGALGERIKLQAPERIVRVTESTAERKDDSYIESTRMAYTALSGIAPGIAKDLNCTGKNVVLYGPEHSEELLSVRAFSDQLELLRARLKMVLDIPAPNAPDKSGANAGAYGVSALAGPVVQSVVGLTTLFQSGGSSQAPDMSLDESGLIAVIANAITAQGCLVYWPSQYSANPFNPSSQLLASLQSIADLNDSGSATGKTPGLLQRIRILEPELRRSEAMSQALTQKIEREQSKLTEANKRMETQRARVDWLFQHIHEDRDTSLQLKLNKTFERLWDELDAAVKKKLATPLPQSIEDQSRLGEVSKRVDLLKTQTDLLSQYVKDEKDLLLQDKLKRTLTSAWDDHEAALKNLQALTAAVQKSVEPDENERQRWTRYSAELKDLMDTTTAASEAYTSFRGALLDTSSGTSPLNRMLRAEALRDLIFDEKLQERPGSSIVQLKLQRLGGTARPKLRSDLKEGFSGGVILSFVQYEPNGKVKNAGVHTAYSGFQGQQ